MYVIKQQDGSYFHKDGKIILFENERQFNDFLNGFVQYSVERLSREGRAQEAMSAPIRIMTGSRVMSIDFEIDKAPCGVIWATDLMNTSK